jgi:hypothetical protein
MDKKSKEEIEKMDIILERLKDTLLDIDVKAGVTMLEKDGIVEEMRPLVAAVQTLDYRLKTLSEDKDRLVREFVRAVNLKEVLAGKEAQEAYIR